MLSWTETATICALIACLGAVIDILLLDRFKRKIKSSQIFLKGWNKLDDTQVPNIPNFMATYTLHFINGKFILTGKNAVYIKVAIFSAFLTTLALIAGGILDWGVQYSDSVKSIYQDNLGRMIDDKTFYINLIISIVANFIFDIITTLVTIHALTVIVTSKFFKSIAVIFMDAFAAFTLAIISLSLLCFVTHKIETRSLLNYPDPTFTDYIIMGYKGVFRLFGGGFAERLDVRGKWMPITYSLYSSTMLIPTAIYLVVLFLMLNAKLSLTIIRLILLYIFERAIEIQDRIFTLFGTFFSLAGVIIRTALEFVK